MHLLVSIVGPLKKYPLFVCIIRKGGCRGFLLNQVDEAKLRRS